MPSVYSSVLDHPADEVWGLIRDFNNYPSYIEGAESAIEDDKRGDQVGAIRRSVTAEPGCASAWKPILTLSASLPTPGWNRSSIRPASNPESDPRSSVQ